MRINVAGMLLSPVGTVRSYPVDFQLEMEKEGHLPLTGAADLSRTNKGILVSARFDTQVFMVCSRCLRHFPTPLSVEFKEEFITPPHLSGGITPPEGDDETDFSIGENQVLDLVEAFRQYIVMSLPLKPLCQPLCLGLCPQCGQDLNQGFCSHQATFKGNP